MERLEEEIAIKKNYVRKDEMQKSWKLKTLGKEFKKAKQFYPADEFAVYSSKRKEGLYPLGFPEYLALSDNYYRLGWRNQSNRRLKNVNILLEWVPDVAGVRVLDGSDADPDAQQDQQTGGTALTSDQIPVS